MFSETAAAETTSQPEPVQPATSTNSQEEPATQGQLPESAAAEPTSTIEVLTDSATRG